MSLAYMGRTHYAATVLNDAWKRTMALVPLRLQIKHRELQFNAARIRIFTGGLFQFLTSISSNRDCANVITNIQIWHYIVLKMFQYSAVLFQSSRVVTIKF